MARTKGALGKRKPELAGKPCAMAFLFRVMEDPKHPVELRVECAKAIMPYQHQRLATKIDMKAEVQVTGVDVVVLDAG